jgi:hypothetical protein
MPDQLEAVPCPRCGGFWRMQCIFQEHRALLLYKIQCVDKRCSYNSKASMVPDPHRAIDLWNQAAEKYVKEIQHD